MNTPTGSGMRVALGSGAAIFLIGTIFWAGATYQRIGNIEAQLRSVIESLGKFGDLSAVAQRGIDNSRRIDKVEERLDRDEREGFEGKR